MFTFKMCFPWYTYNTTSIEPQQTTSVWLLSDITQSSKTSDGQRAEKTLKVEKETFPKQISKVFLGIITLQGDFSQVREDFG